MTNHTPIDKGKTAKTTRQLMGFPRINFTQEKVLITGPAIEHILEEVNLQENPEGRKELVNQVYGLRTPRWAAKLPK